MMRLIDENNGLPDASVPTSAGAELEVRGLRKRLPDGSCLLEDISFRVRRGEFVGLLGASGAGKSLTLRCVLGLSSTSGGSIRFRDDAGCVHDLVGLGGRRLREARRRMGVIFQGANLVGRLRVIENVMIGRLGYTSPWRAWLLGFDDAEARAAMKALARTKIAHLAARVTGSLSGGELQRVAIARAVHQDPDLYLADEPISSLDPGNARAIMELLRPLAAERPVLGVFHQPDMVAAYCTRAIAIKGGCVCYDGDPAVPADALREIYGEELATLRAPEPARLAQP
ncbi:MAG: ATP-binding cassette domain-containing protein [Gammaproteobacteria bacterium]|nr:ATP-binding cassette domain-containing protein [Gammaproteobacteria bacterium]